MVQLPAVNTPQFNWCRTKLPKHPKPVPPIFEPEVPAEAVYWAAHHRRRELVVGFSALKAIVGNKLAPRFADWYLARTGFDSQQVADMPVGERRDNLFEPVPDEAATRGMFDAEAKRRSYLLYMTMHRRLLAGLLAGAAGTGGRPVSPQRVTNATPHVLREYALLADGERGALVGPHGELAWMCFPRWHDDAAFAALIGGGGTYAVGRSTVTSGAGTTRPGASSGAAAG